LIYIVNIAFTSPSSGYAHYTKTLTIDSDEKWEVFNIPLEPTSNDDFYILSTEKIGSGSIQKKPEGNKTMEKIDMYDKNSPINTVLLTATPDEEWEFVGWSEECSGVTNTCLVKLNDNKFVVAHFRKKDKLSAQYPERISHGNCFISLISKNSFFVYNQYGYALIIALFFIRLLWKHILTMHFHSALLKE